MSNSQEQSLDEDVVFLPLSESSPQFLYCEKERRAVERLLSSGPEAFYSSISTELSGCFLSPEEISQISSWAQGYRFKPPPVETQSNTPPEDFCSTYFPPNSDVPTPDLELGWPEKDAWPISGSASVHTNPPAEGDPPIREIIRQHLQKASKVGLSELQHIFTLHVWFIPAGIICHLKCDVILRDYTVVFISSSLDQDTGGLLWCERCCVYSAGCCHRDWQTDGLCSHRRFTRCSFPWRGHLHHPESEVHSGKFHAQETQASSESPPINQPGKLKKPCVRLFRETWTGS